MLDRLSPSWIAALVLAVLALAVPMAAEAQDTGRLEGRIVDNDGDGLAGVAVAVEGLDLATLTDGRGRYRFDGVPAGTYAVSFTLGPDVTTENGVVVEAGQTTRLDPQVAWEVSFADSVVVYSASRRRERIVEAPAAVTVLSEEEVAREASHGQVPKLLEFTPGAEVTQSGLYDFNFNTRGFNSSLNRRIVTLIDGRDPAVPFLGAQEWAAISFPLDDLASVELIRGPSSALYGANAFNGVLNMVTKQPRYSDGGFVRLTAGELSTINGDARVAGELAPSWYYKAVAGYRSSDDFTQSRNVSVEYPGLPRERIPLVLTENEIAFGGLRLEKYLANGHVATAEGGYAELEGPPFQTGIGRVQLLDVERPWLRANYNAPHWNFLAYWNGRDGEQQSLLSGAPLFLDSENYTFELQGNADFLGGRGRVIAGASYSDEDIDTADPLGRQTLTFQPVGSESWATFAQAEFDIADRLKLVLAGRYDDSDLHDSQFSPKGSLVWGVTPNQTLRFTYNEAFQVANYSEFFLRAQTAVILPNGQPISSISLAPVEIGLGPLLGGVPLGFASIPILALGNENLEVEEIKTWEIGYAGSIANGRGLLTLEYYNSEAENFISDLLPNLGPTGRLNPSFGAYRPPAALNPVATQVLLQTLAGLAAQNPLIAFLSNAPDGTPILALASYTNFGTVDTQGVDAGLDMRFGDGWSFQAGYSWFDFDIVDTAGLPTDQLQPNSPESSARASFGRVADAWDASLSWRWVDDFKWFVGPFQGTVPSYNVVDLTANYHVTDAITLGVNVSNLLDDEHFEAFGGDILGRRALGSVSFSWD